MNYATKYLNKTVTVKIDRPLGSKHPKHGFKYDLNYGFIPNTLAEDGAPLDAMVVMATRKKIMYLQKNEIVFTWIPIGGLGEPNI